MTTSNQVLFDTNVLVYNQNIHDPLFERAKEYHLKVISGEIKGIISTQNIVEFTSVITDPKKVSKPLTNKGVINEINAYLDPSSNFSLIYPTKNSVQIFADLLGKSIGASPRKLFDVFLVATMLGNNISTILTANTKDFAPFSKKIKILDLKQPLPR